MDEEFKAKANPNVVLVLDYLAVGILVSSLYYAGIILHVVDPNIATNVITGILSAFGVYKATS